MREFLEVFKYTFKDSIKKKSFIISTIVILVIVIGALLVPAIVNKVQSSENGTNSGSSVTQAEKSIIYLIDKSGYFVNNLAEVQKQFPEYQIKSETENNVESLKASIKEKGTSFFSCCKLS